MKAIIYTQYGPPEVMQIVELDKPVPKDDEILIKTHASTVTSGDWRARSLILPRGFGWMARLMFGITKPRNPILGTEIAGEVEAIGMDVTKFAVGDEVFANNDTGMGCSVEYKCMPQDGAVVLKPAALFYDEAAAMSFGGATALIFFRRGNLQSGEKVLINGASGGVGTAAVQLAKHFGAEVTAVCSAANEELVRSLGADHVIDYTSTDFTQNGETYDVIIDILGRSSFSQCKVSLTPHGTYFLVSFKMKPVLQTLWTKYFGGKRVMATFGSDKAADLLEAKELIEAGKIAPIVDKTFPLAQAAKAHRYYESAERAGGVAIIVDDNLVPEGD